MSHREQLCGHPKLQDAVVVERTCFGREDKDPFPGISRFSSSIAQPRPQPLISAAGAVRHSTKTDTLLARVWLPEEARNFPVEYPPYLQPY
jgi:hypothetical protein